MLETDRRPAPATTDAPAPWWRYGAFYQIYPRSFADGNGDGTGDLAGIRSKLDYLAGLGVDAVWLSPWFDSPFRDGGYDVADYRSIHPMFGTLDDARLLMSDAAAAGLRVMFDLVPNHTSSEHLWFKQALASAPGSAARARYHFRDGSGPNGDQPPNNWRSLFGGPAWTQVADGQWYLHLFDPGQPDLNWANDDVCAEFDDTIRFWIELGAAGFRTDVAHGLSKDADYPDLVEPADVTQDRGGGEHPYWERSDAHDHFRRWRRILDSYPSEPIMVAEAWAATAPRLAKYVRPDEFNQAFNFFFLETPWSADAMRSVIESSITTAAAVGNVPTWVLSNHDVMRPATRFGLPDGLERHSVSEWVVSGDRALLDADTGRRRALAASMLAMALPGSVYLYQGEELGLPEVHDLPPDVLDDPIWAGSGNTMKGRDGCRVPIPWTTTPPGFGFTSGAPWLPLPPTWGKLSAQAQTGVDGSPLETTRRALSLRRDHLLHPDFEWLDIDGDVIGFRRRALRCYVNLGASAIPLPDGQLLHSSGPLAADGLPPDTTIWMLDNLTKRSSRQSRGSSSRRRGSTGRRGSTSTAS